MRKIINIILVAIIIVCLSIIGYKYYNYNKDDKLNSEIQDLQPVINEASDLDNNSSGENDGQDQSKEGNYVNSANEEELKSINSDYKMWIQIENTNINYPVVQGSDNDYYLKHNFRKESNISGTVFVESANDIDNDKNIILYGHNMRNGTMFNNITNYKEESFFNEDNKINIIMNNTLYEYEVFSVYVKNVSEVNLAIGFANEDEFINYAYNQADESIYKKDVDFSAEDNLITLVTCSYEFTDARTIVVARRCN
ncbi:class B sortase [Clostridium saudiense]|uniref:class B sortase n=1 Tax=Clostridium saudiense TaxID=1414720 RepID=UPI000821C7E6|nr:class B sortase [Clostridium saudiense]MDU7455555.1 class B sortase [Clostridium saudiense]SCJ99866.1 Sortase (surface protein transpeptidase) [uncultured Clostridium sp.]